MTSKMEAHPPARTTAMVCTGASKVDVKSPRETRKPNFHKSLSTPRNCVNFEFGNLMGADRCVHRSLETFSTSANIVTLLWGRVAQLGERVVRNDEAAGSIPATSTIFPGPRHLIGFSNLLLHR